MISLPLTEPLSASKGKARDEGQITAAMSACLIQSFNHRSQNG
ncbi:hypothetical protein [Paenibacillus sp. N3.4]|nr:hypothetical protein [Paenibacillus sp. N3.4]